MDVEPGDVYWAFLDADTRHPVIVVSREQFNRGDEVGVIPVTSSKLEMRNDLPNCVLFQAGEGGLTKECVATAENVARIDKCCLDVASGRLGVVSAERMRDIIRAIGYVFEAVCEPE